MNVGADQSLQEHLESSYGLQTTPYPFRQRSRSYGRPFNTRLAAAAAALFFVVSLLALTVYRLATNTGELVIETDRDDIDVVVKQDGKLVKIFDTKAGRHATLDAGSYELALDNEPVGLKSRRRR